MTARHPGGEAAALRLVEMAGITPPCRLIDLGAGAGGTVRLLRSLGFEALGIDLLPGEGVERGDVLAPPFPPGSFDAALCECAFFLSGDPERALREAARLLRPGGRALIKLHPWLAGRRSGPDSGWGRSRTSRTNGSGITSPPSGAARQSTRRRGPKTAAISTRC